MDRQTEVQTDAPHVHKADGISQPFEQSYNARFLIEAVWQCYQVKDDM